MQAGTILHQLLSFACTYFLPTVPLKPYQAQSKICKNILQICPVTLHCRNRGFTVSAFSPQKKHLENGSLFHQIVLSKDGFLRLNLTKQATLCLILVFQELPKPVVDWNGSSLWNISKLEKKVRHSVSCTNLEGTIVTAQPP